MTDRFSEIHSVDMRNAGHDYDIDFRPSTLLEESQNNGFLRTTKPTGNPTHPAVEAQTTGGRGLSDTESAFRLGANGRKSSTK